MVLLARREDRLRTRVEALRDQGYEASFVVADVTSSDSVGSAVRFIVDRYGRLDTAFNNAGLGGDQTPFHLMGDDVYDSVMDVNVRGVWNCMRHEIAAMLEGGGGAIVNTSSVAGLVAVPAAAPYVAAKHAVIGLTRAAAAEYARQQIRVNAVAPGATHSEITDDWFTRNPGMEDRMRAMMPQRRIAEPEEIAEVASWLCSDRSPFLTGAVVPVDGGFSNE